MQNPMNSVGRPNYAFGGYPQPNPFLGANWAPNIVPSSNNFVSLPNEVFLAMLGRSGPVTPSSTSTTIMPSNSTITSGSLDVGSNSFTSSSLPIGGQSANTSNIDVVSSAKDCRSKCCCNCEQGGKSSNIENVKEATAIQNDTTSTLQDGSHASEVGKKAPDGSKTNDGGKTNTDNAQGSSQHEQPERVDQRPWNNPFRYDVRGDRAGTKDDKDRFKGDVNGISRRDHSETASRSHSHNNRHGREENSRFGNKTNYHNNYHAGDSRNRHASNYYQNKGSRWDQTSRSRGEHERRHNYPYFSNDGRSRSKRGERKPFPHKRNRKDGPTTGPNAKFQNSKFYFYDVD